MIVLTIRTDKPEAEVGLYNDDKKLGYKRWQAHRELSSTIHKTIKKLLESNKKNWDDLEAVICYAGPGSFTGLRIGATVANTLADGLGIPVVGTNGEQWIDDGWALIMDGVDSKLVVPFYGRDPHVTAPKK